MDFKQHPFFRLPNELRYQIYSEVFFSHIRDPPLLSSEALARPRNYQRCIRLWIEGEDLLTHRNWLNEITVEPRKDVHAFLRTCRAAYDDAGSFIYGNTLFKIFSSTKYMHLLERAKPGAEYRLTLPDSIEKRINLLKSRSVKFYSCQEWPHIDNKPRWKLHWSGYCYEYLDPGVTLLGHLNSPETAFLRRARNVQVFANIKTPHMMHLTTMQLQNLRATLPTSRAEIKTSKVECLLLDPTSRKHVEMELWRSEPLVPSHIFEPFLATVESFDASSASNCFVGHWWKAALRKPRLVALENACYGSGNTTAYRCSKRLHPWEYELMKKWDVPWCGTCAKCVERAQRMEGLDQMPGISAFEEYS